MNTLCRSRRLCQVLIGALLLIFILAACSSPQSTTEPIVIESFEDARAIFKEIRRLPAAEGQARVDELWQILTEEERVPLVFDTQTIFLYKGDAEQVSWSGSFNGWSRPGLKGARLGQTDLWMAYAEFPEASRVEYKIYLNEELVVDPVNSNTTFSGMTGVNNVLALPGFTVTDESETRDDIQHGTLTDGFSIESRSLGYTVNYWVYTPAGYEDLANLPAIYLMDGNDFIDERMGALPNILDNMIADGRIEPVLVVFIDQRDPENPDFNRREEEFLVHPVEHANFIADELVPAIDHQYHTNPSPDARLIAGVSYGGLSSVYVAALRTDRFHHLAAYSPSLWVLSSPQYLANQEQRDGSAVMLPTIDTITQCGEDTGIACLPIDMFLSAGLPNWDVGSFDATVRDLRSKGYQIEFYSVQEGHTWDHWRGTSDEMLMYFFGSD